MLMMPLAVAAWVAGSVVLAPSRLLQLLLQLQEVGTGVHPHSLVLLALKDTHPKGMLVLPL